MDNLEMLLTEYWRGTLDPQRQQEVENWIEASAENREKALKYCRLEQYVTELAFTQAQDDEIILGQADTISGADVKQTRPRAYKWARWPLVVSAAAVLVLAVLGGMLGLRHANGNAIETEMCYSTGSGEVLQAILPDETMVWLNSNSKIYYPESFKRKDREVRLEGEAFFNVTSDKEHPFVVQTSNCRVKVLGTQFDVEAYPDNGSEFHTTLVSGSVEMSLVTGGRRRSAVLTPGQRFTYDTENDRASVAYVDTESLTSWRTGCITFYHTSLKDVLSMIGNSFGIRFVINNAALLNDTYSGTFDHQPLEEILSTMEQVTDLHFRPLVVTEEDVYPRYIVY